MASRKLPECDLGISFNTFLPFLGGWWCIFLIYILNVTPLFYFLPFHLNPASLQPGALSFYLGQQPPNVGLQAGSFSLH